jgi:hypothetical protein
MALAFRSIGVSQLSIRVVLVFWGTAPLDDSGRYMPSSAAIFANDCRYRSIEEHDNVIQDQAKQTKLRGMDSARDYPRVSRPYLFSFIA